MYVGVDRASSENLAVPGNHFGGGADLQAFGDTVHGVGIARLAHRGDATVSDAHVSLDNLVVVQHNRPGDYRIR
jgi:hypothetical protein